MVVEGAARMPYRDRYFDRSSLLVKGTDWFLLFIRERDVTEYQILSLLLRYEQHYIESHCVLLQTIMTHHITMVFQGTFEKFPELKVVSLEYGIAWIPHMMWQY